MSSTTELTGLVHSAQIAGVTKAQDLTVAAVRQMADLRARAPKVPAPVVRLTDPFVATWSDRRSDWVKLNESFRERLSDAARGGDHSSATPERPTAVKSSAAKKASGTK